MRYVFTEPMHKDNTQMIYKVASEGVWAEACRQGSFTGSPDDVRDGFIHLSAAHQLIGTLQKYFSGQDDLVLVAYDELQLGPLLKWEPSRGGDLFPHYYGALPTTLALWTKPVLLRPDGVFVLPQGVV